MALGQGREVSESDTLYAIIAALGTSEDLDRVLDGIVGLVSDATDCHACFMYLRDGDRLRMRAASRVYAHLVGRIELGLDEGLTGWVARHNEPAFIRDNAFADPRMKYVPELEEERFQSMAAVPVPGRSGEVIGVVVVHTAAPREFDEGVLNFLVHTATLVAGPIENARLYEEARERVDALTRLAALSEEIAAVSGHQDLYRVVTAGVRGLLGSEACELHRPDAEGRRLEPAAAFPLDPEPLVEGEGAALLELLRRRGSRSGGRRAGRLLRASGQGGGTAVLAAPLVAGREELGVLLVLSQAGGGFANEDAELLQAVGNQVALALKKAELIERLTAENAVRDLFDALAVGTVDVAEARAQAAGFNLGRRHVIVHAEPAGGPARGEWAAVAERVEARLRGVDGAALTDAGRDHLRAMLPLPPGGGGNDLAVLVEALRGVGTQEGVFLGVSPARQGTADGRRSLAEAADAARIAAALLPGGGALAYDDLGAYRYLVHLPVQDAPRDRYSEAVENLFDYDERRNTHLVETLEQYLHGRRRGAATARTLYIHPNTLRQRLDRIEKLSGLQLAAEDLLSLELAVKLARLRRAAAERQPSA
jgi:GAF domain-containing protein